MKHISETHPSLKWLTLIDNSLDESNIEKYGKELTDTLMLNSGIITTSVGLIQKHTIDKTVLKEAILYAKQWEGLNNQDWEQLLFEKLGLEEKNEQGN